MQANLDILGTTLKERGTHESGVPKLSGDNVQALGAARIKRGERRESSTKECYKFRNLLDCQRKRKDGMPGMCASGFLWLRCPGGTQAGMQTNVARGCALASVGSAAGNAKGGSERGKKKQRLSKAYATNAPGNVVGKMSAKNKSDVEKCDHQSEAAEGAGGGY